MPDATVQAVREIGVLIPDDARAIPLGGDHAAGRVAIVDEADYGLVSQYGWSATWDTRQPDESYAGARINGSAITMHKLLTGFPQTDHRNHDRLDNRRINLRSATRSQNNANQRPRGGASRHKGVSLHRQTSKWSAAICCDGKRQYLGLFTSEDAAARAYDAAALLAFGEFAYLNFPDVTRFTDPAPCLRIGVAGPMVTLRLGGRVINLDAQQRDEFTRGFFEAERQAEAWATEHPAAAS